MRKRQSERRCKKEGGGSLEGEEKPKKINP